MRNSIIAATFAAIAAPVAPALADPPPWAPAHGKRAKDAHRGEHYYEPRRLGSDDRIWRGKDGRYHCRRSERTTGLIIGAAVDGLVGRVLGGSRARTAGTHCCAGAGP